ncbi:uncharacterized protein ASPGLDRAFT_50606 [Aspergillus glaucus CBS 516.65]|uniref:Uncharacterized protein n=1 Tax=Aspergillus glaucus CBS 516.65 TaxID=1160497 RepID=A0A1L9VAY2_ASPGL|nr:hypothetical protein ASPGLDRAFT_50606 [Aspergillus glaucus CBS 516.65]OJJ81097.1 hypothetical protein ASPGLDRAFT_50606 [Aspergillus glaucus CBS 516.65]
MLEKVIKGAEMAMQNSILSLYSRWSLTGDEGLQRLRENGRGKKSHHHQDHGGQHDAGIAIKKVIID